MAYERNRHFLWGVATSAHQVEGGQYNDWSTWEPDNAQRMAAVAKKRYRNLDNWQDIADTVSDPDNYISGPAAAHYERYEDDFDILETLGVNSYRFSIEWARIEPKEGLFDYEALAHYRYILESLRSRGITPFVTLHHFTNPVWLESAGGWHDREVIYRFSRYAQFIAENLGEFIDYYVTINEPESYLISRYLNSPIWPRWPYQQRSWYRYYKARRNFHRAHQAAYEAIKQFAPDAQVGFSHGITWFEGKNAWSRPLARVIDRFNGTGKFASYSGYMDFLGVQYYTRGLVAPKLRGLSRWIEVSGGERQSDFGWEIYPEGLYRLTQKLKTYGLPIYITENGVADASDRLRADFIREHVEAMRRSIDAGADIRGYFYWSLLDNYEWSAGFWPRFGLVEVDDSLARHVRPSAKTYQAIIEEGV